MAVQSSVYIAVSLDGYIARPDGDVDWLHNPIYKLPQGNDCGFGDYISSVDTLVMGRNSFEKVLSFDDGWPYGDTPGIVLSSRSLDIPEELRSKVKQANETPEALTAQLESAGKSHLYIDGGETIRRFIRARLIHEMTLTQIPILLGAGISLFESLGTEVPLQLLKSETYENGFVQSRYKLMYDS